MTNRFSQVKRGAEYKKALDNYTDYLKNAETRPTKRLQGGVRTSRRQLVERAVRPFGMDLSGDETVLVKASQASITGIGAAVGSRLIVPSTTTNASKLSKFKPARVSAFRGTGAATYVQSKVTKLFYLKYTGDSFGLPFGALTEAEEEATGAKTIRTAIIAAFGAADVKRISFSPEKVPV